MKISVIIPVLNEGPQVQESMRLLRDSVRPASIEIILVDGGSEGRTGPHAPTVADRTIVTKRGRAHQMHAGALAASGDILLFLHADTRLPEGWHSLITAAWSEKPAPACTAFHLSFDRSGGVYRWIERSSRFRFLLTRVPHGDQAVAVRRDAYLSVGGYPDVPLMEEYYLARKLRRLGPVRLLPAAVVTSARRYETNGPIFNAVRNTVLVWLFYLGVRPATLARMYR